MGVHVPSGDEIADFLERKDQLQIGDSLNFITPFSDDIMLKIFREKPLKKRAKRERKYAKLFRSEGIHTPKIYDIVKLRKLNKNTRAYFGKRPWVAIMKHVRGIALNVLSREEAANIRGDFEVLLNDMRSIHAWNGDFWHLHELMLQPNGTITLFDFEHCRKAPANALAEDIKNLRKEFKELLQ